MMKSCRSCHAAIVCAVLASVFVSILGDHLIQKRIPNGDRVPNPCNRSTVWSDAGSQKSSGVGPRNKFGQDFQANGLVWNETICNKDSDGDGMTNGHELGDPYCRWTMNSTASGEPLYMYHPGICEPMDKPNCIAKNSWLTNCKPPTFDCPAVNESGVKSYDVRFPPTSVPLLETTYICYQFKFSANATSDIIAFKPIIDNPHVVHHMVLFACSNKPSEHDESQTFYCGMTNSCKIRIVVWTFGNPGQCMDPLVGLRIGPGGFQYGILQMHWDNHYLLTGQNDSSGLKIFYTSHLRPHRGEIMLIGKEYFEIPANTSNVVVSGGCSSGCTRKFPCSFKVTSALFHMHRLGRSGNVTLYRNGKYLQTIQDVRAYDFNIPAIKDHPDPIEILPGDELRITCVYDSTGEMAATRFGGGVYDEKCYGFLTYFPATNDLNLCTKWKTIEVCYPYSYTYSKCNITAFLKLVTGVDAKCSRGCKSKTCSNAMKSVYSTGCPNQPDAMQFLEHFFFLRIVQRNDETFFHCLNATQPVHTNTTDRSKSYLALRRGTEKQVRANKAHR